MDEWVATSERTLEIREQVSDERWAGLVADAQRRQEIVELVADEHETTGLSWRASLKAAAPGVHWSTYRNWLRLSKERSGAPWERLRVQPF